MSDAIPLAEFEGQGKSAKFDNVGDSHAGRIVTIEQRQQTDLTTGKVKWWDETETRPMMQWLITIEENGDNAVLYARGGTHEVASGEGESMQNAIARAVRTAGATEIAPGARIAVKHSGLGKAGTGRNAAKLYVAQYEPPAPPSIPVDLFAS
jgi:hypothetical protein